MKRSVFISFGAAFKLHIRSRDIHGCTIACSRIPSSTFGHHAMPSHAHPRRRNRATTSECRTTSLELTHRAVLRALAAKRDESETPVYFCPKLENVIFHAPDLKTEIADWVELVASRRGSTQGSAAFLKAVEIRLPDPGSFVERTCVLSEHSEIYAELIQRGVCSHGVKILFEKVVRSCVCVVTRRK